MDDQQVLAHRFEAHRMHLRAVAYRMLGSASEADDAVQEAWLRVSRSDASAVANLGGWLTTIVARVCLTMLQSRNSRREASLETHLPDPAAGPQRGTDPELEAILADSVGVAMLVVLDTLTPAERLAFVLHDMFAVPFNDIASIVGCTAVAARQHASRARRRVQGTAAVPEPDTARQRAIVSAFLAASRDGDFAALLAVLDPDVVLGADQAAVRAGATGEVRGAAAVAETFLGRARGARLALIDGAPGAVWAPGGKPRVMFAFTFAEWKIVGIDIVADPARLGRLNLSDVDD